MHPVLFIWHLAPLLITSVIVLIAPWETGGLALMVLIFFNRQPVSDQISSIEHKIDYIAAVSISDSKILENYKRLHKTNWEHDFPLQVDREMQKYGSRRMAQITSSSIISSVCSVALTVFWLIKVVYAF